MLKHYADLLKQLQEEREQKELGLSINDKVMIVDGLNFFIRVFSSVPIVNDNGEHIGGFTGFLKSLGAVIRQFQPTRCIIVFDGKGGSARRKKIHSGYKENRSMSTKFNRRDDIFQTVEEEIASMKFQYGRLAEYLQNLPVSLISIDNIEADDVIAYLATNVYNTSKETLIVSDDKDFLQLINDQCKVWRPVEKKLYAPKEVSDRFGVSCENYLMYKLFIGDGSDNIQGVTGVGPKTLQNKLPMLQENRKVTIEEVLDYCEQNKDTAKVFTKILEQKDVLHRNDQLMQLHDVDISGHFKLMISDMASRPVPSLNRMAMKKMITEDKAWNSIPNIDTWLNTFATLASFSA